jgi:hypothetical protein
MNAPEGQKFDQKKQRKSERAKKQPQALLPYYVSSCPVAESRDMVFLFLLPVPPHAFSLEEEVIKIGLLGESSTAFRARFHLSRRITGSIL